MKKITLLISFTIFFCGGIIAQDKVSDLKELRKQVASSSEGLFWFDYNECSPNNIEFYYRGTSYSTKITSLDTCYYEVYKRNKTKYAWVVIQSKNGAPIKSLKPVDTDDFIFSGFGFSSNNNGLDFKSKIFLKIKLEDSKEFIDNMNGLIKKYGDL